MILTRVLRAVAVVMTVAVFIFIGCNIGPALWGRPVLAGVVAVALLAIGVVLRWRQSEQ
ncbi:MAG: hypothetical protein U9R72_11320 [Chloroflexota bacterium]|nr:hypothetical protein [Chloroflexota bacterium]